MTGAGGPAVQEAAVPEADVVVVGQIARDLVLLVDEMPGPEQTAAVRHRREMLGGKGANQAVALAQLGMRPVLVGVVGDDATGDRLLDQARRDGIGVGQVVRRAGAASGLIVDVVDRAGRWRYLEDLPAPVLLTATDVAAAAGVLRAGRWVGVQLQQPPDAVRAAVRHAKEGGGRVVLDGLPAGEDRAALLASADVVRADAREAELLADAPIRDTDTALGVAEDLLRCGPSLVALAAGTAGNVFAWPGGRLVLPLTGTPVADTTGAGDAFTAALIASLARGEAPEATARLAVAAAGATVGHPGGRPCLTAGAIRAQLDLLAEAERKAGHRAQGDGTEAANRRENDR